MCNNIYAKEFNGEKLYLVKDHGCSQIFSMIILTKNNQCIVFDGGIKDDSIHLEKLLETLGGKVAAWFLTHVHADHTGAFSEIVLRNKINIEKIYYHFPPEKWIQLYEPSCLEVLEPVTTALKKMEYLHNQYEIKKGDIFDIDGVTISVLNDFDLSITNNPINNASIVFSVIISGKKLLILGDLGEEGGDLLLTEYGDQLKSDIVQMSHHGQNGVKKEVYAAIHPEICLWPTPKWIWENEGAYGPSSGHLKTNHVKCWMEELGVKKHYISGMYEDDIIIE